MPINSWNYISDKDDVCHMGPMAQDFYTAFGLGVDNRHIAPLDANGVALAGVQELYGRLQTQESQITALEQENADLEQRLADLETAVAFANGIDNELVVWQGKTDTIVGLAEDEAEIFGRAKSCEAETAVAPTISIKAVGTTSQLTWSDDLTNGGGYTIWRSNSPYSGHT